MGMSYTIKVRAFCDIFAYFGQNLVAMETSLRPLQSEMSSLDWSTRKPPVISNHVLAISRRNAFICIYSNFRPKIGCHGNATSSLVYGSVADDFPDGIAYHKTKPCMDMLHTTEVLTIFVIFFTYSGQNLVAMATSLRPLQSEMSSLDCSTTKTLL